MSKNMSSTNSDYNSALSKYNSLQDKYTGNAGYQNSVEQAKKGSAEVAQNSYNQQQSAIRSTGASKSASAAMAANSASNTAANSYANQQAMAMNAGQSAVNSQGNVVSAQQQEGQNKYNRSWGNLGATAGMIGSVAGGIAAMSDENCKDAVKLTSGTDDFFKKYKKCDFKKLMYKDGE